MNFKEFPLFIVFVEGGNVLMINTKRRMDIFFPSKQMYSGFPQQNYVVAVHGCFSKTLACISNIYIFKANRFFVGESYNFMRNEDGINTT